MSTKIRIGKKTLVVDSNGSVLLRYVKTKDEIRFSKEEMLDLCQEMLNHYAQTAGLPKAED